MATYTDRGSGTPATTGTTWATVTNAVDGTPPANPGTLVTYTNAVSSAVGTIEVSGYDFGTVLGASDTLNTVTVRTRHQVNNTGRFVSVAVTCWDGATQIGTSQALTLATGIADNDKTFTPTLAQLRSATFKIRITITGAASTQSRIWSLDHIDVLADYTPPPVAPAARTISAAAGTPAQTAVNLTWADDTAASPDPTYLIERSPDGSTGWTTVASGQTDQTGYTWTTATPGTTYYFRVTGSNASGSSTSNVAGPITTTTYPKIDTFTETFDSLSAWTIVSGTPSVSVGQLRLSSSNGLIDSVDTTPYDFTDSSFFLKLDDVGVLPVTQTRNIAFYAYLDGSNYARILILRSSGGTSVNVAYSDSGGGTSAATVSYNPATMVYLRFTHSTAAATLSWHHSVDGTTWTLGRNLPSIPTTMTDKLKRCRLRLSHGQTAGAETTDPGVILIDSVNIAAVAAGGRPKAYVAGAFTKKPLKVWTGSAWVEKPVKVWTGSTWKTLT